MIFVYLIVNDFFCYSERMKKNIRVVGSIISHGDKVLMLYRSEKETDPSLWGIPAGKVDEGESDTQAVTRELREETGITLEENVFNYLGQLDIDYEKVTIQFPIFHKDFTVLPDIILDPDEHVDYAWMTPESILELPNLMLDVDKIITDFCINKLKL